MVKRFTKSEKAYKPEQHGTQEPDMVAADATKRLSDLKKRRRLATGAQDILTKDKDSSIAIELGFGIKKPQSELETLLAGVVRKKILPDVSRNKVGMFRSAADSRQAGEPVFLDATVVQLDMFGNVSSVGELIDEQETKKRLDERLAQYREAPEEAVRALDVTVTQFGADGEPVAQPSALQFDPSTMTYVAEGVSSQPQAA